jgi:hypothetical protein
MQAAHLCDSFRESQGLHRLANGRNRGRKAHQHEGLAVARETALIYMHREQQQH